MRFNPTLSFLAAFLMVAAAGCSGDDNDDIGPAATGGNAGESTGGGAGQSTGGSAGESTAAEPEPVSETIDAADGGTVETESGSASIEIPAGALSEDTEITLEELDRSEQPDADDLGSNAFEFGPDGTQFEEPVTITIRLDADVPEGQTAVLAVLEDGSWSPIEGSSVSGSEVTAEVTHFSTFAILFVDDEMVVVSLSENCEDFSVAELEGCAGGDVVGAWTILDACGSTAIGDNPYQDVPECEQAEYTIEVDYDATLEFMNDGTYLTEVAGISGGYHLELSSACLTAYYMADDPAATCSELDDGCAFADDTCTCDMPFDDPTTGAGTSTGTYSTDGNTIVMTDDGDEPSDEPAFFCVEGDRLSIGAEADGVTTGYILERL